MLFATVVGLGLGVAPELVFIAVSITFMLATVTAAGTTSRCGAADTSVLETALVAFLAVHVLAGVLLRLFR